MPTPEKRYGDNPEYQFISKHDVRGADREQRSTYENVLDPDSQIKNVTVKKLYFYSGPNYYLGKSAVVFNLAFSPLIKSLSLFRFKLKIVEKLPEVADIETQSLPELFAQTVLQLQKIGLNLWINLYDIIDDEEEYSLAVEYLDDYTAEDAIYMAANWFESIVNPKIKFDFESNYQKIKKGFDRSIFGGPTIYSLIEAGKKRKVPVNYLPIENQFMWGYGKKSIRGRSTVLDVDGIKDTEFTQYKDACKDFLLSCGFPTPIGKNCFSEEEAIEEAHYLGYPVVAKPLAGHKGEGVTTNINNETELAEAYRRILEYHQKKGTEFEGCIVEQQVSGRDHRLLTIGGKFVAALEREPAFVVGDGTSSIEELIRIENETNKKRSNNSRAPLAKIAIDTDMQNFLELQNLTLKSVVKEGDRIYLRRVANISAGGISTDVTDIIHPLNVKLAEDIASFFRITAMGIDVLTDDISKPWNEGNFGIIEINAGPGVYMHLAPAYGRSIDVPGKLIEHFFPTPDHARIPIIVGNKLDDNFCNLIYKKIKEIFPIKYFGSVTETGAYINQSFFTNHKKHDNNVEIILRHIGMEAAVFCHERDNIHDYGIFHSGADIVILDEPNYAERILERELFAHGFLIDVYDDHVELFDKTQSLGVFHYEGKSKEATLAEVIAPLLPAIFARYN